VSIYAFQALGKVYQTLFAPDFLYPGVAGDPALRAETTNLALLGDPIHRTLLRMPAILADLATGALVFALVRRKAAAERSFLIAATVWFNPVAIYNSSAWGQIDALTTVFAVVAVALAEMEHTGGAFFALTVSGLTKPQGFVFGPLLLLRTIQRHGWRGLWCAALGGAAGVILVIAPMLIAGAFPSMIARFADWVGDYPQLSVNGHNLWWLIKVGNVSAEDTLPALGSLSYRAVSLLLFALAYGLVLAGTLRRPGRSLWPAAAYVALAFFFLPTEAHENYGFAALPLLAVAVGTEIRLAVPYAVLTLTMVANYALHDPSLLAWLALPAPDAQLLGLRWANAALNGVLFAAWTAWEVYRLGKAAGPTPANVAMSEKR
jgi:Gpi18-like mannosyltransferase